MSREEIVFTAKFYGIGDPEQLEEWDTDKIRKWYNDAVKLHNKLNSTDG